LLCWAAGLLLDIPVFGDRPVLSDPGIPHGEHSVYRLTDKSGRTDTSTHGVTVEGSGPASRYVVRTESTVLELRRADLTPILVEARNAAGTVTMRALYSADRVNLIYPGPKRNKVEKVDANRYDVRAIAFIVRGFPFDREEKVEFTLVTEEHILGVFFRRVGEERVTVPAGAFDCYKLEAGLTGLKGRLFRARIYFWVEKAPPHRFVRQEDEGITDTRLVELVSSVVQPGSGT
jgi:hypothetical protein